MAVADHGDDEATPAVGGRHRLEPLVREWLLDLQVMGRSA